MAKNKKGLLPNFEIILVAVFIFSFLVWAVSKCDFSRPPAPAPVNPPAEVDTTRGTDMVRPASDTIPIPAQLLQPDTLLQTITPGNARLFVTIEGLKVRRDPSLQGEVLGQLPLFEQVYFMNEVTDSTYQINLGYETADEPWVRIRTTNGIEGWVYGAGVHFYKRKRRGVLE